MKKIAFILITLLVFSSCKSTKRVTTTKKQKRTTITKKTNNTEAGKIIKNAIAYKGVRYKYGGTTKKGMDCSGLIFTAFKEENIALPRTTASLSKDGNWIDLKKVKEGDLLFFATNKNSRKVNHVGLVVNSNPVQFIHSSTSKGVIVSDLKERYWYFAFVQARRVL